MFLQDDQYRKMSRVAPVYSVIPFYVCTALIGSYCLMNLLLAVVLQSFSEQKLQRKRARNARISSARALRQKSRVSRRSAIRSVASLPERECALPAAKELGSTPLFRDNYPPSSGFPDFEHSHTQKSSGVPSTPLSQTSVCPIANISVGALAEIHEHLQTCASTEGECQWLDRRMGTESAVRAMYCWQRRVPQ